jgi:hypothetical protein
MRLIVHNRLNTRRSRGERSLAPALLLVCAVFFSSAQAAQAGVVVDPNGPASKQYSADLETARRQAAGGGGDAGVPGSGAQAPPFGQGVTAKAASNSSAGNHAGDSNHQAASTNTASIGPSDGGRNALAIAAISIGVLLGAGLIALVVRRNTAGGAT